MPKVIISSIPKLSLGQISRLTPAEVRARGVRTCTVQVKNVKIEIDSLGVSKIVQSSSLCIQETHQSTIRIFHESGRLPTSIRDLRALQADVPTGNQLWNKPAWVGCDCAWFLYTCEVALSKYGSSSIMHSNGVYPIVRNPRMVPMMCKHLVALSSIAINVGKEVKPSDLGKETYPSRGGRRPKILRDLLRKKRLTPTDEEVSKALTMVKDYL